MAKITAFDQMDFKEKDLLQYGFTKEKNSYLYQENLNDNFYVKIKINENSNEVHVIDSKNDEEYLPFNVQTSTGAFVSKIRDEVNNIVEDIIAKCFIPNNIRGELLKYVEYSYSTIPEYPWEDTPDACTLKVNNKWYGLIMSITADKLGLDSREKVDIINLKNEPDNIENIIDNKSYFKAYHMNKKYWFTIKLDNKVNIEDVKSLISESYNIVNKKK